MDFEVPDEVLAQTTECRHECRCLSNEGKCSCKVAFVTGQRELILNEGVQKDCPYMKPFGYGYLCTCPTYYALNERYRHHRPGASN